jgi:predicted alpha/beta-fold hydrolase
MRRETWTTPDDDELHVDRVDGPEGAPLLVALHGLEGCSRSLYIQGLLDRARSRGWRGLAVNFRSCASPDGKPHGEWIMNRGGRMYHSGETTDLDFVVERLMKAEPNLKLVVAGVSLGGNVLLKWLGERGESAPIRAAATISVPYDLAAASRHLQSGVGPLYVRYFLRSLRAKALEFAERHPGRVNVDEVRSARTFWEYDDAAVAPIHGFADAADYYARSSSIDFVDRIRVPTLLLSAVDDPFLPTKVLSRTRERASDRVTCLFTKRGGHGGFVAGPPWKPRCWDEDRAVEFLAEHV